MFQIPTLYTSYQELLLDLDILGKILSESAINKDELKDLLFDEYKITHPLPTLEDKRYELSDLVSSDYHISYANEVELAENEQLVDLGLSDDIDNFEFDGNIVVPDSIKSQYTYGSVTDDIRDSIIKEYYSNDTEDFTEDTSKIEGVFNTVENHADVYSEEEEVDSFSLDELGISEEQVDSFSLDELGISENLGGTDNSDEYEDDYSSDDENSDEDDSDYEDDYSSDEDDENSDEDDDSSYDDDYSDEEDDSSDEDDGSYYDDDYSEDEDDENSDEEDENSDEDDNSYYEDDYSSDEDDENSDEDGGSYYEDDYLSDEDDENSDEDDYSSDEDNENLDEDDSSYYEDGYSSDEDDSSYADDYSSDEDNENSDEYDYEYDDDYTEDDGDYSQDEDDGKDEQEDIINRGTENSNKSEGYYEVEEDIAVQEEVVVNKNIKPVPTPMEIHSQNNKNNEQVAEKPDTPVNREDEPKELREFVRKHPRCEVSFALKYFSRKEIEKYILMGKVIKKGTKLHI